MLLIAPGDGVNPYLYLLRGDNLYLGLCIFFLLDKNNLRITVYCFRLRKDIFIMPWRVFTPADGIPRPPYTAQLVKVKSSNVVLVLGNIHT